MTTSCAKCGQPEDKHANADSACPSGDWYSKVSTFTTPFTLEQLLAQIEDAEAQHMANGIIVDMLTDALNDALAEQIKSRRVLRELQRQFMAMKVPA